MKNLLYMFLEIDDGTAILFFGLFIVIAIVLIILLVHGAKKERQRFLMSNVKNEKMTKDIFDTVFNETFRKATKGTHFDLFQVEILDCDTFINMYGQEQLDDAIKKLIDRAEQIMPNGTRICRYSVNTFVMLLTEYYSIKELSNLGKMLMFEMNKMIVLAANLRLEMKTNMAIVEYNEFSRTSKQMWQNAKVALDAAKRNAPNQFVVFSAELSDHDSEEYKFYQEIKQAITDKEFELYYQPIVEVDTCRLYGFESLLRWNHKTLGVLSPGRFLHIMEQSGDINWVGFWAFEELVKQSNKWKAANPERRLLLTMNLSSKQLLNERIVDDMRRIVKKYHAEPKDFCFEVVEFAMFDKNDVSKNNIAKFRQAGFMVAIDNYSMESNSLAVLEKMDVDMIKLDKEFIANAKDNFIVSSIAIMLKKYAERTGALIVAEGIENINEISLVESFDIPYGQGYYFGKPKASVEFDNVGEIIKPSGNYVEEKPQVKSEQNAEKLLKPTAKQKAKPIVPEVKPNDFVKEYLVEDDEKSADKDVIKEKVSNDVNGTEINDGHNKAKELPKTNESSSLPNTNEESTLLKSSQQGEVEDKVEDNVNDGENIDKVDDNEQYLSENEETSKVDQTVVNEKTQKVSQTVANEKTVEKVDKKATSKTAKSKKTTAKPSKDAQEIVKPNLDDTNTSNQNESENIESENEVSEGDIDESIF